MSTLGKFVFHYRKSVLLIWVLVIVAFSFYAIKLPSVLSGNGFNYDGEYQQTKAILENEFGQSASTIILVFEKEPYVDSSEWKDFINQAFNNIEEISGIQKSVTPYDQEGMIKDQIAYGILSFNQPADQMGDVVSQIREKLHHADGMTVQITGEPVIAKDLNEASQKDLAKAEMIGLPIALLVLLFAFGSIVAATIPLVIGVVTILITMGIVYFFHYQFDLSIFILNIVPMIGLALSIDFALLFINRFKEEIKMHSVEEAVKITVATAGRSVVFSALCVFIGLLGLMFIHIDIFRNVALGGMTVVFVSTLCAITFLPAILSLLGPRINSLSVLKETGNKEGIWTGFARFVMRRPMIMLIFSLSILLIGLIPVKDMKLSVPGIDSLPTKYESRQAYDKYQEYFVDESKSDENKVTIVMETNDGGQITGVEQLKNAQLAISKIQEDPFVSMIESPFSLTGVEEPEVFHSMVKNGIPPEMKPIFDHYVRSSMMVVNVYLDQDITRNEAQEWVRTWSEEEFEVITYLGGTAKFEQEIFDEIIDKAPYGLVVVLLSTFFILMFAFHSLLIPIKAIIMNVLSLSATFGIIVWIFQSGHFGVEPVDIALILPVFVFSLVFGLSMDYEVFLISRIHEEYSETRDNDRATLNGLVSTSKIITSAAAIMIVITGAFAFTGVMPVKQLGVGIALAIFIDATIVRMILVPSLMKLMGDWNWWFFGKEIQKGKSWH
ncbi:MMPL family transporter [Cytobacillus sp. FJAT-54145]|uniref:MMPL family transporter n=1 Tax=Cytobacillus spartinae TaxID=3299023 RepID=A0ABW6KJP9_9BACI